MTLTPIQCVRPSDGSVRTFYFRVDPEPAEGPTRWTYLVSDTSSLAGEFYEARFVLLDDERLRPDILDNHGDKRYRGMGITDAIFRHVVSGLGKRLVSSRKDEEGSSEGRSPAADRMWMKLAARGHATYDPGEGRFLYLPTDPGGRGLELFFDVLDVRSGGSRTLLDYVRVVVREAASGADKWEAHWCSIAGREASVHRPVERHSPGKLAESATAHQFDSTEDAVEQAEDALVSYYQKRGQGVIKILRVGA